MSKKIDCLKLKAEVQKKSLPRLKKALQGKIVHEVEIEDAELSSWLERVKSKASKKKAS
ncbi:MAG: hypothetical protein IPM97_03065 [Bdellovibrionaceae bacterium]|nr:hypothetical protein [Pseudobdellovibrionaceae bacterium]